MSVPEPLANEAAEAAQAYGVRLGKIGISPEEKLSMVVAYYDGYLAGRTFTAPPPPVLCGNFSPSGRICVLEKGHASTYHAAEDHRTWTGEKP